MSQGKTDDVWDVLVIGAGPVGLVATLRLSRLGLKVLCLEAKTDISRDLRASTFHPPTLDMLDSLGLAEPLIARGRITPTWQIRLHETGEKAEFDLSQIADATDHPYRLQAEQWKLSETIFEALEPGTVRFRHSLTAIEQHRDRVTLSVDTESGPARFAARYVIAADGGRSTVRELLDLSFEGKTYPETAVLVTSDFPFHDVLEGLSGVNYVWGPEGNYSLLRLPDCWRASFPATEGMSDAEITARPEILRRLHGITPAFDDRELIDVRIYRIHQRIVEDYRHGRILLAGDAAHLNSPSGGMGMNGGVHDAFNLTDKLKAVFDGEDDGLLDLYTRQRRPVAVEQILKQADGNRARMRQRDPGARRRSLEELQATIADPEKCHAFLLRTSMIEGLRQAAAIQ